MQATIRGEFITSMKAQYPTESRLSRAWMWPILWWLKIISSLQRLAASFSSPRHCLNHRFKFGFVLMTETTTCGSWLSSSSSTLPTPRILKHRCWPYSWPTKKIHFSFTPWISLSKTTISWNRSSRSWSTFSSSQISLWSCSTCAIRDSRRPHHLCACSNFLLLTTPYSK